PLRRLATASPRGQPPAIIPEQGRGAGGGVVQSLAAVGSSTSGLSSVGSGIALSRKEHLMRARSKYVWAAAALAALAGVGLAPSAGESACCYFSAKDKDILQPAQKAFITWDPDEKVETFTVQPKFEGNADDFGMVIPTPARPKLDEMPRDFF